MRQPCHSWPPALALVAALLPAVPASAGDEVELERLTSERVSLSIAPGGRPTVLHFWATWCPSCVEELSTLDEVAASCAARVRVLAVNVGEDVETIAAFLRNHPLRLEVLRDPRGRVYRRLAGSGLPANYTVGREEGQTIYGPLSASGWADLFAGAGCP